MKAALQVMALFSFIVMVIAQFITVAQESLKGLNHLFIGTMLIFVGSIAGIVFLRKSTR
jgi:hypothetical protein